MNNRDKSIIYFILGLYSLMVSWYYKSFYRLVNCTLYFLADLSYCTSCLQDIYRTICGKDIPLSYFK